MQHIDSYASPLCSEAVLCPYTRLNTNELYSTDSLVDSCKKIDERPERPPQMLCICATCRWLQGSFHSRSSRSWFRSFVDRCLSLTDAAIYPSQPLAESHAQPHPEPLAQPQNLLYEENNHAPV